MANLHVHKQTAGIVEIAGKGDDNRVGLVEFQPFEAAPKFIRDRGKLLQKCIGGKIHGDAELSWKQN